MMMMMPEDGHGEKMIMTKYARNIFFCVCPGGVCPAGVLVVSPLCFGGRWCLGGPLVVCP